MLTLKIDQPVYWLYPDFIKRKAEVKHAYVQSVDGDKFTLITDTKTPIKLKGRIVQGKLIVGTWKAEVLKSRLKGI